jgi:hypothetical protein
MKLFNIFKKKKKTEDLWILTLMLKGVVGEQPRLFK